MKRVNIVVIGCNYKNTSVALNGCINDAIDFSQTMYDLCQHQDYDLELTLLTDNNPNKYPSKTNIISTIKQHIELCNSKKIDCFIFYFAGHGFQIKDTNGDETDGYDETILSADKQYLKDDEINNLISGLNNTKASVVFVFDCCHSGSILDLPKIIIGNNNQKNKDLKNKSRILCISACDESQSSLEVNGRGIFTKLFCELLRKNINQPLMTLLYTIKHQIDEKKVDMSLTISSNKKVDVRKSKFFKIKS